jgi:catecholate siderophore receptor
MEFGRGGGGGLINRVTKEPQFIPMREFSLQGGSFRFKRLTGDINQPLGSKFAARVNGMYEDSNSFRNNVGIKRHAVNPTLTYTPGKTTKIVLSYENLHDFRVADRGITSYQGIPAKVPVRAYYGNPNDSPVFAKIDVGSVVVEHQSGNLNIINRTVFANYNRGYQNYVPGAANTAGTLVALSAYNNATQRLNVFNQTNLNYTLWTGHIPHILLGGIELGGQWTDDLRNTGYFNKGTVTSITVPFNNPTITSSAIFRHATTDANNHLLTKLGAAYVQDQTEVSKHLQLVGGVRVDQFDLSFQDHNTPTQFRRIDDLVSPRGGLVYKPIQQIALYSSYTVSYLPSSGDQFSSLTNITQQAKPEKFTNYEVGAKFDFARSFALTTAVYRLDRTNTRATDPNNPTAIIQTGATRTNGFELGVNGMVMRKWQVAGGYAYQDAFILRDTTAAKAGQTVAQVPHHTFSLWNNFQLTRKLSSGLGLVSRGDMWAGVDNTVKLPGYARIDAAIYYSITERTRLQVNVENLANLKYYTNADSNTNISPGYPRAVRAGLTWRF